MNTPRLPALFFVLVLVVTAWPSGRAHAQAAPPAGCFPECRVGFTCIQGTCVSACASPCPPGTVCSPAGQCVSACNPPCPAGEICTAAGTCAATAAAWPAPPALGSAPAPTPVPPATATPPGPSTAPASVPLPSPAVYATTPVAAPATLPPPTRADRPPTPGWARGAAVMGFVSAGLTLGLTGIIIDKNNPKEGDDARTLGIATTTLFGIATPAVAIGGSSARRSPGVRGALGLRIAGWIGYGAALLNAVAIIVSSFEEQPSNGLIAAEGILGALSTSAFAIDALVSAAQADEAAEAPAPPPGFTLTPYLGVARGLTLAPTYGLAARF